MLEVHMAEFQNRFETEEDCLHFLLELRWPGGCFYCDKCGHNEGTFLKRRGLMQCRKCRRQCSVTAGTIFHSTKASLIKIFKLFVEFVSGHSQSASASARALNLSYDTVWRWMQKLRKLVASGFEMSNVEEVPDASFIRLLFRRSLESMPAVEGGSDAPDLSDQSENSEQLQAGRFLVSEKSLLAQCATFIAGNFQGVSRKYLQLYVVQAGAGFDGNIADAIVLLRAGLRSGPVTRNAILHFVSSPIISLGRRHYRQC